MYKYREVYTDIKNNILTNHYRAGSLMPTQEELAEKYSISRLTLRKVLQMLGDEGLVYSKQGAGTFVRPRMADSPDEILPLNSPIGVTYSHRSQEISSKVLHFDARLPTALEQKNLNIEANEPVYEIKRVRYLNGKHYSFEHTIMPTRIAPLDEKILHKSIYDYLGSKNIMMTDARRVVYAEAADAETSQAMGVDLNCPMLVIEQTAYDQKGRAFEYSVSQFIKDHSKFVFDVHRQWF